MSNAGSKQGAWLTLALVLNALPPAIADAQEAAPPPAQAASAAGAAAELEAQPAVAASERAARDTAEGRASVASRSGRHVVPRTHVPVSLDSGGGLGWLNGSDLINAAALRGLGPDRVLVLVNGKRRHQMARVVVGETIGKGTSGVDLNAIPVAAIERVEILSDSAAAQYGPSALGGVINIVLKEEAGVRFDLTGGNYYDNDGNALLGLDRAAASVNAGLEITDRGFVNATAAVRDRGETNRAGVATIESSVDGRAFGGQWWTADESCPEDELMPGEIVPCKPVRRLRFGNSDGQDLTLFLNAGYDVSDDVSLYTFGGISHRDGETGAGLFRGAGSGRVPAELYPDGFLPALITTAVDASATLGARIALVDPWELDVSAGWGRSSFSYDVDNTANVSWYYEIDPDTDEIYGETPTSGHAGELVNTELTANVDLTGHFDVLVGLDLAAGLEVRFDRYEIIRGDPVSYSYGRDNVIDPANPIRNTSSFPLIADAIGGTQGFPGFGPAAEVEDSRNAWDVYADAEQHLTEWWMLAAGARLQNTQFTGKALVGKLGTRVDAGEHVSFRASGSNGSRSPGVQQIYYSQRATAILPAGLTETVTVGDANPLRGSFGIGQLHPETSLSGSAGVSFQMEDLGSVTRTLRLTGDAYLVQIDDRIVLSESVTGEVPAGEVDTPGRQTFRALLDDNQLGAAQFFVNAVDTRTVGLDLGGLWGAELGDVGLDLSAVFKLSKTSIEGGSPDSELVTGADLFGPIQRNRMEKGQPRLRATFAQLTRYEAFSFSAALDYFGEVTGKNYMALEDEKVWSGKWLTDAAVSYELMPELVLTVGAENLFDVRPDKWGAVGREWPEIGFIYGLETLPFGVNGGFYYANVRYSL